jgi:Icc-related predicted phosphoesterase
LASLGLADVNIAVDCDPTQPATPDSAFTRPTAPNAEKHMKIQIFSDLHIDVAPIKPIVIAEGIDVVITAGDICEGSTKAFDHLRRIVPLEIPIVAVMGNHEPYHRFLAEEIELARARAPGYNIRFLECDSAVVANVRFLGASFWTDYAIFGESNISTVMHACATGMNDHRLIGWQKKPWMRFRPQEAALLHHRSKAYLAETLAVPFSGPSVVVSHHAVLWDAILPRFRSDPLTGAFVSDQRSLIERYQPALWVHGHIHNSVDLRINQSRVICNPHGYGDENPAFDGSLVVEVTS